MINWSQNISNVSFQDSPQRKLTMLAAIVSITGALMYFAITSWFPQDIGTTAKYIDSLGLQPALDGATCFSFFCDGGFAEDVIDVSAGSAQMSLGIALFQMLSGGMIAASGLSWGKTTSGRQSIVGISMLIKSAIKRNIDPSEFNYMKLMYVIIWIAVASVDTYTDVAYRAGQGTSTFILANALITSLFFYNFGSEFILVSGVQILAHFGAELVSEVFGGISMKGTSSKKSGGKSSRKHNSHGSSKQRKPSQERPSMGTSRMPPMTAPNQQQRMAGGNRR